MPTGGEFEWRIHLGEEDGKQVYALVSVPSQKSEDKLKEILALGIEKWQIMHQPQ